MPLSMYQASVPLLLRGLQALSGVLKKGETHKGSGALIAARLAPDMLPLAGQVQRASDTAKGCAARLAGIGNPSFPDTEASFAELYARIDRTAEFLRSVDPRRIEGAEETSIVIQAGPRTLNFTGESYLTTFVLPNFYFHVTTAYAILRHSGAPVGKIDYLGAA